MRLLFIGSELHPPFSNMESQMVACLRACASSKNIDSVVLTIRINKLVSDKENYVYVKGYGWGPLFIRKLFYALELLYCFERELSKRVDLVHFVWVGFPILTKWMIFRAKCKRCKVIYTVLSSDSPPKRYFGSHVVVVHSKKTHAQYLQAGYSEKVVKIIPPPVDKKRFHPSCQPAEPYFVTASSPFASGQLRIRGVPLLFKAFGILQEEGFPVRLRYYSRWIGGYDTFKKLRQQYGLKNVDIYTGFFDDMPDIIAKSSGVIVPFKGTGDVPLSAVEALCCGRSVLITEGLGLSSEIKQFKAGIVVNGDPESIAVAVKTIIKNPEYYYGGAIELAKEFDISKFLASYLTLYGYRPFGNRNRLKI